MYNQELQKAIKEAQDIAKNGKTEEQNSFVEWVSEALQYASYQGNSEDVNALKEIYTTYLTAKQGKKEESKAYTFYKTVLRQKYDNFTYYEGYDREAAKDVARTQLNYNKGHRINPYDIEVQIYFLSKKWEEMNDEERFAAESDGYNVVSEKEWNV